MKKTIIALFTILLLGCGGPENIMDQPRTYAVSEPEAFSSKSDEPIHQTALQKSEGKKNIFNFDVMSKGKRKFQIDKSEKYGKIFGICDDYEGIICSTAGESANKIDGAIGYLDSATPVHKTTYNRFYRLVLENGDIYYLELSRVYDDKDILGSALSLIDLDLKNKYQNKVGQPIKDGSSIIVNSVSVDGRLIYLDLSTGEKVHVDDLENRIGLLDKIISSDKFDQAFPVSKDIYAPYDDFEQRWWLIPRLRHKMPAYFYAGVKKDGSKWLRTIFRYHGSNWIFFDKVSVISGDARYDRSFNSLETDRDNDESGVYESVDIAVTEKEAALFESISKHGAKVRLSGKYQDTSELTEEQRVMLNNLYELYKLI